MTERRGTAVVIKLERSHADGAVTTTLYGPFLPHVGSAVDSALSSLIHEAKKNEDVLNVEAEVRTVFIGEGESDCAVVATR